MPVFKGAVRSFVSTPAVHSVSASRQALRSHTSHLARTRPSFPGGFTRGVPRGPAVPALRPSVQQGPGLQLARQFSSNGTRPFADILINAPLFIRAAADELEDDLEGLSKSGAARRGTARRGVRRSDPATHRRHEAKLAKAIGQYFAHSDPSASAFACSSKKPAAAKPSASGIAKAAAAAEKQAETGIITDAAVAALAAHNDDDAVSEAGWSESEYSDYFIEPPESPTAGPHTGVCTILRLPAEADADLAMLIAPAYNEFDASSHPLDAATVAQMRLIHDGSAHLCLLIDSLTRLLAARGLDCPWTLAPDAHALHGVAFEVSFEGWTKPEVQGMLVSQLGHGKGSQLGRFLFERASSPADDEAAHVGSTALHSPPSASLADLQEDIDALGAASAISLAHCDAPPIGAAASSQRSVEGLGIEMPTDFVIPLIPLDHSLLHSHLSDGSSLVISPELASSHGDSSGELYDSTAHWA
jgi:hypothetical protein